MSKTIDSRVLDMRFENRQFEAGVQTSINTLDKLKKSLNISSSEKGISGIGTAATSANSDFMTLASGIDAVRSRFSALQIIGVTTLANLTTSAVNYGKRLVDSLTIEPIRTGLTEYETKINSIQTIMSNTANKGVTMKDVTRVLDELNTYADKTIYNFAEMTRNIGTFTAAGVGLEESANAIQGIANLAAASGSSSQQASTAMYQLSQALATGTVKLMDWNSVVNAGMGGQKFQEALKATAREHGIAVDQIIKKNGSFRDSLQEGWLSADILNQTLRKFTVKGAKEYSKSMVESGKWTKKQADALIKEAQAMEDAATKVKTFTQLLSTLKEAAQSGWAQSWEIIIGDFEEAKIVFTAVSESIGGIIGKQAEFRNNLLQGWKDLGGRSAVIEGFANIFKAVLSVVTPVKEAFREIIPATTAKHLYALSVGFKNLTSNLILSEENSDRLKRTFKGLFSIVDFFRKIVVAAAKAVGSLLNSGSVNGVLDLILSITAGIGDFFTALNKGFSFDAFPNIFSGIADVFSGIIDGFTGFDNALSKVGQSVSNAVEKIVTAVKTGFEWLTGSISLDEVLIGLGGAGVFTAAKKLKDVFETINEVTGKGILGILFGNKEIAKPTTTLSDILASTKDALKSFTSGIKIASLVSVALAVTILAHALKTLSGLKAADITKSLFAVGALFAMLSVSFKSLTKTLDVFSGKGFIKAGVSMILMAKAIDILAGAMKQLAGLSFSDIVKGLLGIGGAMTVLSLGLRAINKVKIKASAIVAITVLAASIKSIAKSLSELGSLSWGEISRGLTAMGLAMGELVATLNILKKVGGFKSLVGSIGILILVQSLDEISGALTELGGMSWGEIARGLTAMGGALTELAVVSGSLGKLAGLSGLVGSFVIVEASKSLANIASALTEIGSLTWGEIARGLTGMAGALTELAVISGVLGKVAGLSGLVGAIALVEGAKALADIASSFTVFSTMSWEEIIHGLAGMGGALTEVATITGLLGKLAGFSGLLGAGTILIVSKSLSDIANSFSVFSTMSWEEIKRGLAGMGGALTEVSTITGLLGKLAGFSGLIGAGTILIVAKGLGDIANALKIFGTMTWEEIGRGLAGMGGALTEISLASGVLGKVAGLSGIIGGGTILIVSKGLGDIANALKIFGTMTWEEIGRGLAGMAGALAEIAIVAGVLGNVAGLFGLVGALTISMIAEPLGKLADSVRKWAGVKVPDNLGKQLSSLAGGVLKFTLGGLGASAIANVAVPLGDLAKSVNKWNGVTVPDNLKSQLSGLADGIKSFTWAFVGGMSIDVAAAPLGDLANSVKKWNGVTVPENLKSQLSGLADGVKSFTWAFVGGFSIGKVAEPLGKLAVSVKKWNGVSIPKNLGGRLKGLAESIKSFSGVGNVTKGVNAVSSITSSLIKLSKVGFKSISSGLEKFASSMEKLGSSSSSLKGVGTSLTNNIIKPINNLSPKVTKAGSNIASALAKGLNKTGSVKTAAKSLVSSASKAVNSNSSSFKSAGSKMATAFASGLKSGKGASSAAKSMSSKAAKAISKSGFKSAGKDAARGFANGISANTFMATAKAKAMGEKALKAARKAIKVNSPSKEFMKLGRSSAEGFALGIDEDTRLPIKSATRMAVSAMDSTKEVISKIGKLLDSDMDVQPTISPVVDLSNVKAGAGAINGLLGKDVMVGASANLSAINYGMSKNQNGVNDDVVSAINKLRKDLGNISGDTYQINGVTYDDGSNITDAVHTLVRAAKVERRK